MEREESLRQACEELGLDRSWQDQRPSDVDLGGEHAPLTTAAPSARSSPVASPKKPLSALQSLAADLGGALPPDAKERSSAEGEGAHPATDPEEDERERLRWLRQQENFNAESWFGGRIFQVGVAEVLRALGGADMVKAVEEERKQEQDPAMRKFLEADFKLSKGCDWLQALTPAAGAGGESLVWVPTRRDGLAPCTFRLDARKPDAILTVNDGLTALPMSWQWPLALAHYTARDVTQPFGVNWSPDQTKEALKAFQWKLLFNLYDLRAQQPWRLFALGIAVCADTFYLALLDSECVRFAQVDRCWSDPGFARFSAIVGALGRARLHEFGFSPFFDYNQGLLPFRFVPRRFSPSSPLGPIAISPRPLSDALHAPFSRATLVLGQLDEPSQSGYVVVKVQMVEEGRARREALAAAQLWGNDDRGAELEGGGEIPRLLFYWAFPRLRHQTEDAELDDQDLYTQDQKDAGRALVRRHVEILVYRTSTRGYPLNHPRPGPYPSLFDHLVQLVELLELADQRGVLHRDISRNNVLVAADAEGRAKTILIDWDCAAFANGPSVRPGSLRGRVGTFDTMSVAVLLSDRGPAPFVRRSRHDLESALYVCLKSISVVLANAEIEGWKQNAADMAWDKVMRSAELAQTRENFWRARGGVLNRAAKALSAQEGAEGIAALFRSLAKLDAIGLGASTEEDFVECFSSRGEPELDFAGLCAEVKEIFRQAGRDETDWWRRLWAEAHQVRSVR